MRRIELLLYMFAKDCKASIEREWDSAAEVGVIQIFEGLFSGGLGRQRDERKEFK